METVLKERAGISQISEELQRLPRGYENAILLVGGEDCDTAGSKTAVEIVDSYKGLVKSAKEKACQVTVSSVPPRLGSKSE